MSQLFSQRVIILVSATMCLAAVAWFSREKVAPEYLLDKAQTAFSKGKLEEARSLCENALSEQPDSPRGCFLLGEIAMQQREFRTAFESFVAVPDSHSQFITARFSAAEAARGMGWIVEAENLYLQVLEQDARHLPARERLAFVLDLQGRRFEARKHLYELLRRDQISFSTLIRLGSPESAIPFPDVLDQMRQSGRNPAHLMLADAVNALSQHDWQTARQLLRDSIRLCPSLTEAHARVGQLLIDLQIDAVPNWNQQLPKSADSHPEVWVTRGLWCKHAEQVDAATRCFLEALKIDPNHRVACTQLAKLHTSLGHPEAASLLAVRAQLLQDLAAQMNRISLNRQDVLAMSSASQVLENLGRSWEAYGWCGVILMNTPANTQIRARMQRLQLQLYPELPNTNADISIAALDVESLPLPSFSTDSIRQDESPPPSEFPFRFVDVAEASGLNFSYFNSHDPTSEGTPMYAFSGGGIGILDFDRDGWPDINFTQGCKWPPNAESEVYRDQLYRNLGDGSFANVTSSAGTGDGWFSQGEAVGDINNDGFQDLYIANIGRNRVLLNNGDGTFSDVTDQAGILGDQWTTSCLMADLDGDQNPDLYDVNYLRGPDLFERLCLVEGRRRACVPDVFPAERDRIHLSTGHLEYQELTNQKAEVLDPARAGLGIVALDMDRSGRLSLFIANDVTANALLLNESQNGEVSFAESALLAGVAFDQGGRAQACMGVAADDVDGNGFIDLFVTNYYEEANSLYLQQNMGLFNECSRENGLFEPGFHQLGFGTQFLDANLDGYPELVVANGHLDDFTYMEIPRYMRPQFFSNLAGNGFRDVSDAVGDYFAEKLLGRSLAVLDWNCDGRPDFVVSHLEAPVALVSNETPDTGNWIKFNLCGSKSPRIPFGTEVSLQVNGRTWTRQLTGGSGFQASNEQMLLFGLGEASMIDTMSIRWPSGTHQEFHKIPVNKCFIVIESIDNLYHSKP